MTINLKKGLEFKKAIIESFQRIEGNSALVLIDPKTADIYAIKRCAPLVCGINEVQSEGFASSDPYALAGLVDKLYFPEDEVLCHLSSGNKTFELLQFRRR